MPRRKRARKRTILPDPLFQSEWLAKFMNAVMRSGKKSLAEQIVYNALDFVAKKLGHTKSIRESDETRTVALESFKKALENITPSVEVKSRRVGGSTYQVPVEIRGDRRRALAMRWLVKFSKKRKEKTMSLRLANEILDALENRGEAVKKREDTHRMAKANQAFAHYRW